MRPRKPFPADSVDILKDLLRKTKRTEDTRRIQAVLMRALDQSPPSTIAAIVGLSVATVRSLHSQFLRQGVSCLVGRPGRGGSRRRKLSDEAEARILDGFIERAKIGGVLNVGEIREAIQKEAGHQVGTSTIYRLMSRRGWRKVAPRPHHPKRDPAAVEPFKKNLPKSLPRNRTR